MNKKVLTYFMLLVVIAIWGRIVYTSFFNTPEEVSITSPSINQDFTKKVEIEKEEVQLIADYRDPFLGKSTRSNPVNITKSKMPKQKAQKLNEKVKKKVVWPAIDYFGLVKNEKSSTKIALVSIEKKQVLLKEGEGYEDLSMLKIYNDSILLSLATESKTFVKN